MPKLEPEVDFSVVTFTHELAKYLNFTVRRPGAVLPRTPPRTFHQLLLLQRRFTLPHPCSRRANLTIHTCLLVQGWWSTSTLSIMNKRSCCLVLQVRPRSDPDGLVLRSSACGTGVFEENLEISRREATAWLTLRAGLVWG